MMLLHMVGVYKCVALNGYFDSVGSWLANILMKPETILFDFYVKTIKMVLKSV